MRTHRFQRRSLIICRPMYATLGKALAKSSITFVSQAAYEDKVHEKLGLEKVVLPVHGIRKLTKKDMKLNSETPELTVDPQTYEVKVNGELIYMRRLIKFRWGSDIFYFEVKRCLSKELKRILKIWKKKKLFDAILKKFISKVILFVKRVQRVKTDHGREIGIRLKEARDLVAGDVLYMDEKNMIVIDVLADDLLVISPRSFLEMGTIAHQLGNRHLPAQFEDDVMMVQYDYFVEELLNELEIPYKREKRKVKQAFRHIGHSHG